ncbi:MAG TPA: SurA N-terminal domain-containing protein, partial [Candidatus Limnocylindria bacterium]|nr:SurA N-terminal domain-containing protein [Candidatus Limnocylindria bacterium]
MFLSNVFVPTGEITAMLDVLRRNAGSWAIKGILTFIALTFIWWGVGSYSQSRRDVAATVGEEKISMAELAEAHAGLEKTYRDVYGSAFTPEMAKELDLRRQALDSLVRRKLMLAEAAAIGLVASNEEVQREISATPAFQVDGAFNEDRYRSILSYNRVSPAEYEVSKKEEITIRKMEGLFSASARVSDSEARDLFDLTFRKIRLLVVTSDPAEMRGTLPATEGEIAAKYEQTRESYRVPARVKLSVARFSPETFAGKEDPSEEEIQAFYEGNAEMFRTEESRLAYPVIIPYTAGTREAARKKAEEVVAEARKGKTRFEEIAKKLSRGKGGATWVKRQEMLPELADGVFSAPVDDVVGPVDTGNGFTIVRVNQIKFTESLPLERIRDRVITLLKHEKGRDTAVIRAYEAHAKAMESNDLEAACAPFGVTLRETGWTSDGKGIDVPPAVAQEALLLAADEIGPVTTVGDTHYLFRVTAKENSRVPPMPDVRTQVAAAVEREKRTVAARAELENVLADAKTASELKRNATRAGLGVTTTPFFAPLSGSLPGVLASAGDIRRELLGLSPKSPVSPNIFPAGPQFLSIALVAEQPVGPVEWEAEKDSFVQGLAERKRMAAIEAFLAERMKQAKLKINPEALK